MFFFSLVFLLFANSGLDDRGATHSIVFGRCVANHAQRATPRRRLGRGLGRIVRRQWRLFRARRSGNIFASHHSLLISHCMRANDAAAALRARSAQRDAFCRISVAFCRIRQTRCQPRPRQRWMSAKWPNRASCYPPSSRRASCCSQPGHAASSQFRFPRARPDRVRSRGAASEFARAPRHRSIPATR